MVRRCTPLDDVAHLMLAAMGWTNSHLHCFYIGEYRYDMVGPHSEGDELDEIGFTLRDVFDGVGRTMRLEYDFGDGWEHDVVLESVRLTRKAESNPHCMTGKRACPPEDCGGPHEYASLLDLRRSGASSEWDRERLAWLGEFEAEAFDPIDATDCMQNLLEPIFEDD